MQADGGKPKRSLYAQLAKVAPPGAEAIVGTTVDLQGVCFLTEGTQVRRAVAYVEVNDPRESKVASGFLVSPSLFLTNQHVISDFDAARGTQITFDREMDENNVPRSTTTYLLDPDAFALFSSEGELDYALIAVGRRNAGSGELDEFGYCVLSDAQDKHVIGMNVNIIQHPRGWPKMIAIRNNLLTHRTDRTLLYETDTLEGTSGSPVYNDYWDLIALHHWAQPFLERQDDQGRDIPSCVNEGVRISAIYRDLQSRLESLPDAQKALLGEMLSYANRPLTVSGSRTLSPPRPHVRSSESVDLTGSRRRINMEKAPDSNELRTTIPLEISIRIGSPDVGRTAATPSEAPRHAKVLTRGAEAIQIDHDYGNRGGYDPQFIPGANLLLPSPKAALSKQVAPLHADQPDAASGELKYEHFSVKMNKSKRMALFTATNIDGATYLEVNRKTGQVVSGGSEGETWFKDPRISASYFLDQTFYSDWSHYFDRGHLTRRTDPTWGTEDEAERANGDTYHFTNCSPQHFRFNETTKYWQGAERYVLENGLLETESKKRISVFQGPLFDDTIDCWSDDVQIPSSFFKVIVWMGASGLKSVGLIVDQSQLMSETRKALGGPKEVASVDVHQWRVAVSQIEKRTGLDFGQAIRKADTITSSAQPTVGEEAGILLHSFEDLLK
ncbi:MAG: DNA/RNA non-specific endonuclease [bacterium]